MRKIFALMLAVLMLASFATVAFAQDSPTGEKKHDVDIIHEYPTGSEDMPTITVGDDDTITVSAKEKDGFTFDSFVIEGDYEVVKKNGNTWVIRAKSDLKIHVRYSGKSSSTPTKPAVKPVDNKPTSPKTGDNTAMVVVMMLVAMGGIALASKKLSRN